MVILNLNVYSFAKPQGEIAETGERGDSSFCAASLSDFSSAIFFCCSFIFWRFSLFALASLNLRLFMSIIFWVVHSKHFLVCI